jgi:hypothetical protein
MGSMALRDELTEAVDEIFRTTWGFAMGVLFPSPKTFR